MAIIGDDTHGTIDPEKTSELCGVYRDQKIADDAAGEEKPSE